MISALGVVFKKFFHGILKKFQTKTEKGTLYECRVYQYKKGKSVIQAMTHHLILWNTEKIFGISKALTFIFM